jgi:hypothetical protein
MQVNTVAFNPQLWPWLSFSLLMERKHLPHGLRYKEPEFSRHTHWIDFYMPF